LVVSAAGQFLQPDAPKRVRESAKHLANILLREHAVIHYCEQDTRHTPIS
jgi:hypothetical protein